MSYEITDQHGDVRGPRYSVRMLNGNCVITLQAHCMPYRTPQWEAEMRATMSPAAYARQFGLNWSTPGGDCFYPEAAERIREIAPMQFEGWYIKRYPLEECGPMEGSPILCGWDAGQLRPALVMGQYDREAQILWYFRELRLEEMQGPDVIMLGGYLTGRFRPEDLQDGPWKSPAALAWIRREQEERFYGWPMPWLPYDPRRQVLDFMARWEGNHPQSLAPSEEVNTWQKLARQRGIRVQGRKEGWDHRETTMRFLLREGRIKGYPRALWDPSCRYCIKGLAGGLQRPTTMQKFGGPKRDRLYEDVHDACTYIAAACYPLSADLQRIEREQAAARESWEASIPRPPAPFRQPEALRQIVTSSPPRIHWGPGLLEAAR